MASIPVILLAAGGSSRMGSPKQLLPWGNQTLIEHQIKTLKKIGNPINIVLGANINLVIPVVEKYDVNIFVNHNWGKGIGSSIAVGVKGIYQKYPVSDGVLITLVDQPLITSEHYRNMLNQFQPGKDQIIVSGSASGWKGVPVLFDKSYFLELQNINDNEGAKKIVYAHEKKITCIVCDNSLEDMDTPLNYQKMHERFAKKS